MSPDLLTLAQNYFVGNTVRQLSATFTEEESRLHQALPSVLALALGALLARLRQPGGPADIFARVYRVNRRDPLGNFASLLAEVSDPAGPTPALDGGLPGPGPGLLASVLGSEQAAATAAVIAQGAGVAPATVRQLLALAVPVGLGLLGRHAVQHTLDARGLASYLATQQEPLVRALRALPNGLGQRLASLAGGDPAGQGSLLEFAQLPVAPPSAPRVAPLAPLATAAALVAAPPAATLLSTAAPLAAAAAPPVAALLSTAAPSEPTTMLPLSRMPVPPRPADPRPGPPAAATGPRAPTPRRWPWLLALLLAGVLALAAAQVYLLRGNLRPMPTPAAAPGRPAAAGPTPPAYLAGRATLRLAGGALLRVSNNSAEARLYHFLQDPTQLVSSDKTQGWLLLDQVYFAPGTTTLMPESLGQLHNLAAILQAFPRASIKLGGYTDDQHGTDNNLLLSADCANAARRQLLARRIAPSRVAARGYGQARPRTAPPAGHVRSRRVYVRVTKK